MQQHFWACSWRIAKPAPCADPRRWDAHGHGHGHGEEQDAGHAAEGFGTKVCEDGVFRAVWELVWPSSAEMAPVAKADADHGKMTASEKGTDGHAHGKEAAGEKDADGHAHGKEEGEFRKG